MAGKAASVAVKEAGGLPQPRRSGPWSAVIALAAVYRRTTGKYGERGIRYVHMEVGHAAQNVCLQAVALGLGTVVVGAFNDRDVKQILSMGAREEPLCLISVGRPR